MSPLQLAGNPYTLFFPFREHFIDRDPVSLGFARRILTLQRVNGIIKIILMQVLVVLSFRRLNDDGTGGKPTSKEQNARANDECQLSAHNPDFLSGHVRVSGPYRGPGPGRIHVQQSYPGLEPTEN